MKKTLFILFAATMFSLSANAQSAAQETGMEEISQAAMNEEIQEAEQSINELELVTDSPIDSAQTVSPGEGPKANFNPEDFQLESLDEMDLGRWKESDYPEYIDIPNVDTILPSVNPSDSYILKRAEKSTLESDSKVKPSRSVIISGNQYLDVFYPGKGWIYLGETENTTLLRYFGHTISTKDTMFTLRARGSGKAVLHFYKIDPLDGTSIDDYLEVVISGSSDGTSHVTAPSYAEAVPEKKYKSGQTDSAQTSTEPLSDPAETSDDLSPKNDSDSIIGTKTDLRKDESSAADYDVESYKKTETSMPSTASETEAKTTEETKVEESEDEREIKIAETSPSESVSINEEPVKDEKTESTANETTVDSSSAKTETQTSRTQVSNTSRQPSTNSSPATDSGNASSSTTSGSRTSTSTAPRTSGSGTSSGSSSSAPRTSSSTSSTARTSSSSASASSSSTSSSSGSSSSAVSSRAESSNSTAAQTEKRSGGSQPQTKSSAQSSVIGSSADDDLLEKAQKSYNAKKYGECLDYLTEFFNNAVTRLDEGLYLQGQALEAPSDYRNIKAALDTYETLVKQYPKSKKWKQANERVIYLKRFYFNIR